MTLTPKLERVSDNMFLCRDGHSRFSLGVGERGAVVECGPATVAVPFTPPLLRLPKCGYVHSGTPDGDPIMSAGTARPHCHGISGGH